MVHGPNEQRQLVQARLVGLLTLLCPGGEPRIERILIGGDDVAAQEQPLDAVFHAGEQRHAQNARIVVRHFQVADENGVVGFQDDVPVIQRGRAVRDCRSEKLRFVFLSNELGRADGLTQGLDGRAELLGFMGRTHVSPVLRRAGQ